METWTLLVPVSCLLFLPGQLARSLGLLQVFKTSGQYSVFFTFKAF